MGAADLLANGKDVAVIDYHTGDVYDNSFSLSRLSYYGLAGTPTAWFDGGNAVVGGNHTVSMYGSYLPKYNLRKSIQSSFTIDVTGTNSGLVDYELNITLEKIASTTATNIAMHVVVTESGILQNWQGMSSVEHVERLMAPNQNGTSIDFSNGDIVEKTIDFTVDPSWVNENCEVIVFLQNTQTKEVLQATKYDLSNFEITNTTDAALLKVMVPQTVCESAVIPKVKIANYGLDNLTSLDISYDVDGGAPMIFSWTGNLATYATEIVELNEIGFTPETQNTFHINCENPNGTEDQYPANNALSVVMEQAENVTSPVSLALKLDDHPDETTWELVDSQNNILYSGGPYSTNGQFIVQQFVLNENDCFSFNIYDEGGNGLTGTGSYKLAYMGSTIFAEGKDFGFEDQLQFGIGLTGVDNQSISNGFEVYPNPVVENATINFTIRQPGEVQLSMYNTIGKLVYQSPASFYPVGDHSMAVLRHGLDSGIYFIQLKSGDKIYTHKVVLR